MRRTQILRALTILGFGAAGLVGGHALGYAVAFPDVHHRTAALAGSGHGYIPSASWLAVVIGIAAVVTGIAAGAARSRSGHTGLPRVTVQMIALQSAAFLSLEIVERLVSDAPMGSLSPALVALGLLAQVAVAIVLGLVVVGLRRIGERIAAATDARRVRGDERLVSSRDLNVLSRTPVRDRVRGPPSAVAA